MGVGVGIGVVVVVFVCVVGMLSFIARDESLHGSSRITVQIPCTQCVVDLYSNYQRINLTYYHHA
jgi:hypothetical protein